MQPETVLAALKGIADGFAAGLVSRTPGTTDDPDALLGSPEWAKAQGWVARQSGIDLHPAADTGKGAVIEAEVGNATASLQIRRKDGGWITTKVTEGQGEDVLIEDVQLVTTLKSAAGKPLAARYRRYWTLPDHGAAEIIACRLVKFEEIAE